MRLSCVFNAAYAAVMCSAWQLVEVFHLIEVVRAACDFIRAFLECAMKFSAAAMRFFSGIRNLTFIKRKRNFFPPPKIPNMEVWISALPPKETLRKFTMN